MLQRFAEPVRFGNVRCSRPSPRIFFAIDISVLIRRGSRGAIKILKTALKPAFNKWLLPFSFFRLQINFDKEIKYHTNNKNVMIGDSKASPGMFSRRRFIYFLWKFKMNLIL